MFNHERDYNIGVTVLQRQGFFQGGGCRVKFCTCGESYAPPHQITQYHFAPLPQILYKTLKKLSRHEVASEMQ